MKKKQKKKYLYTDLFIMPLKPCHQNFMCSCSSGQRENKQHNLASKLAYVYVMFIHLQHVCLYMFITFSAKLKHIYTPSVQKCSYTLM